MLSQLHLKLALMSARSFGEDVQNESSAVYNLDLQYLLQISLLGRRELVIEDRHIVSLTPF